MWCSEEAMMSWVRVRKDLPNGRVSSPKLYIDMELELELSMLYSAGLWFKGLYAQSVYMGLQKI